MAKGIYVGVGGTAKKVKKLYAGVGGAVKKVKKVFVGIGGIPKLAYSLGVSYYGRIDNPSIDPYRSYRIGVSTADRAFFGSSIASEKNGEVGSYDKSLVALTGPRLSEGVCWGSGAATNNVAMYAGGITTSGNITTQVDAFSGTTGRAIAHGRLQVRRTSVGGSNNDDYCLFSGGRVNTTPDGCKYVDAFDASCVQTSATGLEGAAVFMFGGYLNHCAILGGGENYRVYKYDNSLTQTILEGLPVGAGSTMRCASADTFAMFYYFLKRDDYNMYNAIVMYNQSFIRTVLNAPLGLTTRPLAMEAIEDCVVMVVGTDSSNAPMQVYMCDASLVLTEITSPFEYSFYFNSMACAKVNNYFVFSGGTYTFSPSTDYVKVAEVFEV